MIAINTEHSATSSSNSPQHTLQGGQEITLERDGSRHLVLKRGITDVGTRISENHTLHITGDATGSRLVVADDAPFAPRIKVGTSQPLEIAGSFRLASGSTQIAHVNITPVQLTRMEGVDKIPRRTVRINDPDTGEKIKVPKYVIETSGDNLHVTKREGKGMPKGSKYFEYAADNDTEHVVSVEPNGGRINFVNGSTALFTLDGREEMAVTAMRFKNARNNAMNDVIAVLDSGNPMNLKRFTEEKARVGVAEELEKGKVDYKDIGTVDTSLPAVAPDSSFVPGGIKPTTPSGKATEADKALLQEIAGRVDHYHHYTKDIFAGQSKVLDTEQGNLGKRLGDAMLAARDAAKNVVDENGNIRHTELAALHRHMDSVETLSAAAYDVVKDHFSGYKDLKSYKAYVAARTKAINLQFTNEEPYAYKERLNKSEMLRNNQTTDVDVEMKRYVPEAPNDTLGVMMGTGRASSAYPQLSPQPAPGQGVASAQEQESKIGLLERLARQALGERKDSSRLAVADVDSPQDTMLSVPSTTSGGGVNKTGRFS